MQRTCNALAVHCSAILQCTARPLKCKCCQHTAASQCRCNTLQVKHNVLQGRVQCTWEWSAMHFKRSISLKCTEVCTSVHWKCTALRSGIVWSPKIISFIGLPAFLLTSYNTETEVHEVDIWSEDADDKSEKRQDSSRYCNGTAAIFVRQGTGDRTWKCKHRACLILKYHFC